MDTILEKQESQLDRKVVNEERTELPTAYAKKFSCQNHLLVVTDVTDSTSGRSTLSDRNEVKKFSASSATRMRRYLRTTTADYTHFITLTYPHNYERDGRRSKEHLRRFIQEYKRECERTGANMRIWGAFWFMEFQKRGAIHYHLFTTNDVSKSWLSKRWYEICGTEDKRHLAAGTNIEKIRSGRHGTCSYAAKYAAKCDQKEIPSDILSAGRFWGVSGLRLCVSADTTVSAEDYSRRSIKRAVNELKDAVTKYVACGDARVVLQKEGVFVMYMKTMEAQMEILAKVRRIEMNNAMYSTAPRLVMPEYETPLSFGLFEDIDHDISLL